jgi:hypothetical protein
LCCGCVATVLLLLLSQVRGCWPASSRHHHQQQHHHQLTQTSNTHHAQPSCHTDLSTHACVERDPVTTASTGGVPGWEWWWGSKLRARNAGDREAIVWHTGQTTGKASEGEGRRRGLGEARQGKAAVRWFGRWGKGMASQTSIRKALGAIKDSTKVGLATINSTNKVRIQGLDWIFSLFSLSRGAVRCGGMGWVRVGGLVIGFLRLWWIASMW